MSNKSARSLEDENIAAAIKHYNEMIDPFNAVPGQSFSDYSTARKKDDHLPPDWKPGDDLSNRYKNPPEPENPDEFDGHGGGGRSGIQDSVWGDPETLDPYIYWYEEDATVVNDWLKLFDRPTVSENGRVVEIPEGIETWRWPMLEGYDNINKWARQQLESKGIDVVVNKGEKGELTDAEGRYWVAVGPRVLNPDHNEDRDVYADDFVFGTKLDAVIMDMGGNLYYIPCVVGDIKAHTYPNGIYQTGYKYPSGEEIAENNADYSII